MALPRHAFAPGKGGFAIRRLDDFGIARIDGVTAGIRTRIFWFTARNSDSLSHTLCVERNVVLPAGIAPASFRLEDGCL